MKTIELHCASCGNPFVKELREYKRQVKVGRTEFFCTRTCAAVKNNEDNPRKGNPNNLKADNRRDEFTPFRWYVLRGEYRDRQKGYGCNLTPSYLKNIWDLQNGICPLTGWKMILPLGTAIGWMEQDPSNASLDRIDNSKGYIEGNVRFVALMANLARQSFTDEQMIAFCKAVATNN